MLVICVSQDGTHAHFQVTAQDMEVRRNCNESLGDCDDIHVSEHEEFVNFLESLRIDLSEVENLIAMVFQIGAKDCSPSDSIHSEVIQKIGEVQKILNLDQWRLRKLTSLLQKVTDLGREHGVTKLQASC